MLSLISLTKLLTLLRGTILMGMPSFHASYHPKTPFTVNTVLERREILFQKMYLPCFRSSQYFRVPLFPLNISLSFLSWICYFTFHFSYWNGIFETNSVISFIQSHLKCFNVCSVDIHRVWCSTVLLYFIIQFFIKYDI